MHLSTLILENFRSHSSKTISFSPHTNLILGHNGSGKTNILEAVYFLSSGKSFRSSTLSQLLNWNSSYSTVIGQMTRENNPLELEVQLVKEPFKTSLTRKFLVDKAIKTRPKYLGTLQVVVFEPEDIRLVAGSPSRRRDFLDSVFSAVDWRYSQSLSQFNRALKHRNELLDQIREGRSQKSELFYWDQSLIKNSNIIQEYRQKFIKSLNQFFLGHFNPEIKTIFLNYHPSTITQEKLDNFYPQELAIGYTQSGPHRDDFSFNNSIFQTPDKNLAFWGSRGQQRLAVLALRLGQINYLEQTSSHKPILLLDDIFSELDLDHRQLVVDVCHNHQTIFTSAEDNLPSILPTAQIINL